MLVWTKMTIYLPNLEDKFHECQHHKLTFQQIHASRDLWLSLFMLPKCVLQTPWRWNLEAIPKNTIYCKSNPKWPRVTTYWQIAANFLTIVATAILSCATSKIQPLLFSSSCKWNGSEARERKGVEGIKKDLLYIGTMRHIISFFNTMHFFYLCFIIFLSMVQVLWGKPILLIVQMKLAEFKYEH